MLVKKCPFCAWCKRDYPEEIGLTIYPIEMKACPRCTEAEFTEIETDAVPIYHGAPAAVKKTKTLF